MQINGFLQAIFRELSEKTFFCKEAIRNTILARIVFLQYLRLNCFLTGDKAIKFNAFIKLTRVNSSHTRWSLLCCLLD